MPSSISEREAIIYLPYKPDIETRGIGVSCAIPESLVQSFNIGYMDGESKVWCTHDLLSAPNVFLNVMFAYLTND